MQVRVFARKLHSPHLHVQFPRKRERAQRICGRTIGGREHDDGGRAGRLRGADRSCERQAPNASRPRRAPGFSGRTSGDATSQ